ncbi:MAG: glyoxalase [Lachnospiraceae bacterium]|nr:glyoxalase [Lachnospiraceae bacterium]
MKLKNILIVVEDIERSKAFYKDLFGLTVVTDFGGNVILTEGLVLQEKHIWEKLIGEKSNKGSCDAELFFEENDMDGFLARVNKYQGTITYLNELMEHSWGQKVVRFFDPDGHLIEVGESLDGVARRYLAKGMTEEEVAEKTQLPLDYIQGIQCQCTYN